MCKYLTLKELSLLYSKLYTLYKFTARNQNQPESKRYQNFLSERNEEVNYVQRSISQKQPKRPPSKISGRYKLKSVREGGGPLDMVKKNKMIYFLFSWLLAFLHLQPFFSFRRGVSGVRSGKGLLVERHHVRQKIDVVKAFR